MFLSRFFSAYFFDASYWGKAGALIVPKELIFTFAVSLRVQASTDNTLRLQDDIDSSLRQTAALAVTKL